MPSLTAQYIKLFISTFRGRTDLYAKRWEKEDRSGYSPAYKFNWEEFKAHKRRGGSIKDFENKRLLPLTTEVIKKHLLGLHTVGIYPILPDNTSYFLAADFDGETWKDEAITFIHECLQAGLTAYLERSRSGNGGHVWIFFSEPYPCYNSRQIGLELIRRSLGISIFDKEISFDRLFPNQDTLPKGGFGNLIVLPLQGKSIAQGNTVFIDIKTGNPFSDQWKFLETIKRHSALEMDTVRKELFVQKSEIFFSAGKENKTVAINVTNQIILSKSQLTPDLIHYLKEELNFLNTEYLTKRQLGKSTYKVEKCFKLIEETENAVSLPRGFLSKLIGFLKEQNIGFSVHFKHPHVDQASFINTIELTSAQKGIVDAAIASDQGVIVSPSGSGKTIIGLELVARRKLPALILVHRKQIMDQWNERIQTFLGIPRLHIGQYSGVKKKIGKQITVGLLQSLARKKDLSELRDRFGTIIVDECHHIPASTFRKVVEQLNCRFMYGLTATPKRKHNDEKLIYVYIGDIIADLSISAFMEMNTHPSQPLLREDRLSTLPAPPEIILRTTNLAIPFTFTTDLFHILAKVICFDTSRNRLIIDDILRETSDGRKVLVLSERKDHLDVLNLYLKGKCETIVITGDDSMRMRNSKMKQIQDGHYQAVLSTGQYFGEGIDVKGITCIILAFPFSFEGKLLQYIGRMRDSDIQKRIIDYRDKNIPFLETQYKKRKRVYKKLFGSR
jgi:superfamily II DNA or RNA helicase